MLGGIVKGIGSALGSAVKGIGGAAADVSGLSDFTSALGMDADNSTDKPKAAKVKAFDEDESPTKILQRILTEVQTIHKVMASQVVPPSEEEEIQRDKDKKDDEVLKALEDLRPEEDKKKKKKTPWWKMLWAWMKPFIAWITKPLSWIKSLLKLPFFMALKTFAVVLGRFFLFTPIGRVLLTVGIVAINWIAIKKAIKGYINKFKDFVVTALNAIGLGGMIQEEAGEYGDMDEGVIDTTDDVYTGDDSSLPPQLRGPEVDDIPPQPAGKEGKDWFIDENGTMNIIVTKGDDDLSEAYTPTNFIPRSPDEPLGDIVGQTAVESEKYASHSKWQNMENNMMVGKSTTDNWFDDDASYGGLFQVADNKPKGKIGLAREGPGLKSVGGNMLGSSSGAQGPAAVKREPMTSGLNTNNKGMASTLQNTNNKGMASTLQNTNNKGMASTLQNTNNKGGGKDTSVVTRIINQRSNEVLGNTPSKMNNLAIKLEPIRILPTEFVNIGISPNDATLISSGSTSSLEVITYNRGETNSTASSYSSPSSVRQTQQSIPSGDPHASAPRSV